MGVAAAGIDAHLLWGQHLGDLFDVAEQNMKKDAELMRSIGISVMGDRASLAREP